MLFSLPLLIQKVYEVLTGTLRSRAAENTGDQADSNDGLQKLCPLASVLGDEAHVLHNIWFHKLKSLAFS